MILLYFLLIIPIIHTFKTTLSPSPTRLPDRNFELLCSYNVTYKYLTERFIIPTDVCDLNLNRFHNSALNDMYSLNFVFNDVESLINKFSCAKHLYNSSISYEFVNGNIIVGNFFGEFGQIGCIEKITESESLIDDLISVLPIKYQVGYTFLKYSLDKLEHENHHKSFSKGYYCLKNVNVFGSVISSNGTGFCGLKHYTNYLGVGVVLRSKNIVNTLACLGRMEDVFIIDELDDEYSGLKLSNIYYDDNVFLDCPYKVDWNVDHCLVNGKNRPVIKEYWTSEVHTPNGDLAYTCTDRCFCEGEILDYNHCVVDGYRFETPYCIRCSKAAREDNYNRNFRKSRYRKFFHLTFPLEVLDYSFFTGSDYYICDHSTAMKFNYQLFILIICLFVNIIFDKSL